MQPTAVASDADAEELARAEVYGLLAALFYAPPDAALHSVEAEQADLLAHPTE